jgi:hypothetical protein
MEWGIFLGILPKGNPLLGLDNLDGVKGTFFAQTDYIHIGHCIFPHTQASLLQYFFIKYNACGNTFSEITVNAHKHFYFYRGNKSGGRGG